MELTDDYRPPEEIWHHQERLKEWFDSLSNRNSNNSYADIPHDPRIDNSAAADYRRKIGAPPA